MNQEKDSDFQKGEYFKRLFKKYSDRGDDHFSVIGYNALSLITDLNLSICPYCNRNFINSTRLVDENNISYEKRTAQLDHFYPKSKYPYLAISFYNLIPACGTCNLIKLEEVIGVNPYEISDSDDHLIFDYKFDNTITSYEIDLVHSSREFLINWKKLGLEIFNKNHNSYLNDLMLRIQLYNTLYRKDLTNYFNEWGKQNKNTEISITKEDFEKAIFGNHYLEDLSKFPLSKLTKDIVRRYK